VRPACRRLGESRSWRFTVYGHMDLVALEEVDKLYKDNVIPFRKRTAPQRSRARIYKEQWQSADRGRSVF
jgi:hypothetical protein